MDMPARLLCCSAVLCLLFACRPTEGWYKQTAGGPNYYSVGRASGLLSGIRRSPYAKRGETERTDGAVSAAKDWLSDFTPRSFFKNMPVCIKEVTPILQSCELSQGLKDSFKCTAEVFLSLDSADCAQD